MKNHQNDSSIKNSDQEITKAIDNKIKKVDEDITFFTNSLQHSKEKGSFSTEDLIRLATKNEEEEEQQHKLNIIERIDQKKGFFNFWFVKVPARNMSLASLTQNQQSINDSIRALSSPICPICAEGILMYNKRLLPNEKGNVKWFCSNESACSYHLFAEPSLLKINSALNATNIRDVGRIRWENLTEKDKSELIESHFLKANLFRSFAVCLLVFIILIAYMQMVWGVVVSFICLAYVILSSLRWCYRAWQIKTGQVFQETSPFIHWIRTAESYYNLDWLDQEDDQNQEESNQVEK